MTVIKEYLSQLRQLDNEITSKLLRIEELRAKAAGIGSPGAYSDRVQVSRGAGIMGDLIDQAVDMEEELQPLVWQYLLLRDQIINQIHALDEHLYVDLLYLKYVGMTDNKTGRHVYLTLKEIAYTMRRSDGRPYTEKHICRIHTDALKALGDLMEQRQQD